MPNRRDHVNRSLSWSWPVLPVPRSADDKVQKHVDEASAAIDTQQVSAALYRQKWKKARNRKDRFLPSLLLASAALLSLYTLRNLHNRGRLPPTWELALTFPFTAFEVLRRVLSALPRKDHRGLGVMMDVVELMNHDCNIVHRPSDVIFAIPLKSGTTVLTHMAHTIRTGGIPPSFDDQSEVIPWIEMAPALWGTDLNAEQIAHPRLFKSHLPWSDPKIPKNGKAKIVYSFRDPADMILSAHKFALPLFQLNTKIVTEDRIATFFLVSGMMENNLKNLVDFWKERHKPYVLFLFYDDIIEDREDVVRRMARFIGGGSGSRYNDEGGQAFGFHHNDESLINAVTYEASHSVMSSPENFHRFVDIEVLKVFHNKDSSDEIDPTHFTGKVRRGGGRSGQGRELLSNPLLDALDRAWRTIVTPATGFKDLKEMREARKKEVKEEQRKSKDKGEG